MISKTALDSDLYSDIYGEGEEELEEDTRSDQDQRGEAHHQGHAHDGATNEDDEEVIVDDDDHEHDDVVQDYDDVEVITSHETLDGGFATSGHLGSSGGPGNGHFKHPPGASGLPAKPGLSYSAQVARQFSAYQQTPSQERQTRTSIPTTNGSASASTTTTTGDTVFGKKPSEMHDSGKMFVGGLNWDTTDESLRDYFSQFGKVDACTIMRDANGTSRGFAFLTFEEAAAVETVMNRTHELDGKMIDPKRAIPRDEHLRNTRYFIGGLSPTTTTESIREFFAGYGKVVDATVMLDRETGRSKGFGFVTFEDTHDTERLVGKLVLDDKQIEVKAAQPRSQRDSNGAVNTSRQTGLPSAIPTLASVDNIPATPNGMLNNPTMPLPLPMQMMQQGMGMSQMQGAMPNGMQMPLPMQMQMGMAGMGMPMGNFNAGGGGAAGMQQGMMNMNQRNGMGMGMGMGGMPMMNPMMNPMMMGMNPMMMNQMMGMGMNGGMQAFSGAGGNQGGGMRLGMGPLAFGMNGGGATAVGGGGGRGGMAARGMMRGGPALGATGAATGTGPARMSSRGQHSFHPYAR